MERLITLSQRTRAWPIWLRYLATAALVFLVLALWLAIGPTLRGYPFVLFYPVVILAALVFDRGSGLFATAVSAIVIYYFLLPARDTWRLSNPTDLLALALFVVTAVVIAVLIEAVHTLLHRLRAAERDLKVSLEEMSHRTRNNLQLLASMLSIESRTSGASSDEVIRSAIERIRAFGRIHNRLVAQGGAGTVDAARFLGDLCADLQAGLIGRRLVTIQTELEPMTMGVAEATSFGLLVNELVTNAMKHAFADRAEGIVRVALRKEDGMRALSVADNGAGMPEAAASGFGMHVVRALVAQTGGQLDIHTDRDAGTTFTVRSPERQKS